MKKSLFPLALLLAWSTVARVSYAQSTEKSEFPEIYNSESEPGDPISPKEALASLNLPEGFSATLFAAEPDVQNPIGGCIDAAGRVWIAENYTYAERAQKFDLELNDRVVVLEDTNGDGNADKRTVFIDSVQMLTGITVGRGGVWLMCPPRLLFIPDANEDLVPDGPPQVKLDGFHVATENYHNFANGLSWGPDNWLYGRCGASCPGEMGIPGSPNESRVPIRGGIWRYHPERDTVEALTQGTTNPWGHDWNSLGDLFFINTVNGHFWHAIPGAHFVRPHTLDVNPYTYELIDMHADHWHFDTGKSWTASRDGAANDYGGGHAHIGMMIYQEDLWPQQYNGAVLTVNMHGRRINHEILHSEGSGYVAKHGKDFLLSDDTWFRGMELLPTPDGNMLLLDWSDTGECHDHTGVHRTSGRIFKIQYARGSSHPSPLSNPIVRRDTLQLANLQLNAPSWQARRARELLAQHALMDQDVSAASQALRSALFSSRATTEVRLRALWGLVAITQVDDATITRLLNDPDAALRSWGVRLLVDPWAIDLSDGRAAVQPQTASDSDVERLVTLATSETSAAVRLQLASALQRLPHTARAALARPLLQNESDGNDHNLPLMVWYGITPLGDTNPDALETLLQACEWSSIRQLIARRIADRSKSAPETFDRMVSNALGKGREFQSDIVLGTSRAMAGWRRATAPTDWEQFNQRMGTPDDADTRHALDNLNILFGNGRTISDLKEIVTDSKANIELRKSALQTLVDARAPGIEAICMKLLPQRFLNTVAAKGLVRNSSPAVGEALVNNYRRFHPSERQQVLSILTSRQNWSKAMLTAVADGKIGRSELSASHARQIASFEDEELMKLLQENWGQVRATPAETKALIERLREDLTVEHLAAADQSNGRRLFEKSCASCHTLFGEGGKLGPDLTGSQRSNLDYLIENIADPSAVVTKEFRASIVLLDDDRVLVGLMLEQNENTISLATQTETFRIPTEEIVDIKLSTASTMPAALLEPLSETQIRDLFAYLQSRQQVAK